MKKTSKDINELINTIKEVNTKNEKHKMGDVRKRVEVLKNNTLSDMGKIEEMLIGNSINLKDLGIVLNETSNNIDVLANDITDKWGRIRNKHLDDAIARNESDKARLRDLNSNRYLFTLKDQLEAKKKHLDTKEKELEEKISSLLESGLQASEEVYTHKILPAIEGKFKSRILGTIDENHTLVKKYMKVLGPKELIEIPEKLRMSDLERPNYTYEDMYLGTNINDMPKYAFEFDDQKSMENGIQFYALNKRRKVQVMDGDEPTGEVKYKYEVVVSDYNGTDYGTSYHYDKRLRSVRRIVEDYSDEYCILTVGKDPKFNFYVENLNKKSEHNVVSIQHIKNDICVEMASDTFKFMMLSEKNMLRIKNILEKIYYIPDNIEERRPYDAIIKAVTNTPPVFTHIKRPNRNEKSVIRFVLANMDLFNGTPPLNQLLAIENKNISTDVLIGKILPNTPNFQFIFNERKNELKEVRTNREYVCDKLLTISTELSKLEVEKESLIVSTSSKVLEALIEDNEKIDELKNNTVTMAHEIKKYKQILTAVQNIHKDLASTSLKLISQENDMKILLAEIDYRNKKLDLRDKKQRHFYEVDLLRVKTKFEKEVEERKKKNALLLLKEESKLNLREVRYKSGAELTKQKIIIDGDKDIKNIDKSIKKMSIDGDKSIKKMSIDGDKDIKKIIIDGDKSIKKMSIKGDKDIKKMDVKVNKKKIEAQTRLDKSKLKLEEKKNKQSYELDKAKLELEKIIQKQKIILAVDELDLNRAKILAELELKRIELVQRDNAMVMNMASKITSESLGMQLENGEGSYRLSNKKKPMFKPEDVVDFVSSRVSEYMAMRF